MDGKQPQEIDFYTLEESWAKASNYYSADPEGDCIATAKRIFKEVFQN
jgi:alpha-N-acetylglucosaminidase